MKKAKKQSHPRSRDSWMNSDGEDLDHSDGSAESYMVRYEVWKGDKIAVAFNVQFKDMRDWVCIDSGTNKLILMDNSGWNTYHGVIDEFLKTASEGGKLAIEGRGKIGVCDDALHCPNASANLIPVDLINMCGTTITFGMHHPNDLATRYCEIQTARKKKIA